MFWFGLSCPLDVPFRAVWPYNTHSSCLETINHRIVNMSCLRYLETQHHIMLLEVFLSRHLDFLELTQQRLAGPVISLEESYPLFLALRCWVIAFSGAVLICLFFIFVTILGVGEENTSRGLWLAKSHGL
jgi:hypothetical protein